VTPETLKPGLKFSGQQFRENKEGHHAPFSDEDQGKHSVGFGSIRQTNRCGRIWAVYRAFFYQREYVECDRDSGSCAKKSVSIEHGYLGVIC